MSNDDRRTFTRDLFDRDDDRDSNRTRTIRGTNGNDVLIGTSGNDNISGSRGDDIIHAGAGSDRVRGDDGNDTLYGDGGNDALDGGRGNDALLGGTGNDELDGGEGNDLLFGDDGSDDLKGGKGDDTLFGGAGRDELEGGDGNDALSGDEGDDELEGGKGNDVLAGGAGNDELEGDEGNDVLAGGAGNDNIDGGKGFDAATFSGRFDDYRIVVARNDRCGDDDREGRQTRLTVIDVRNGSPDGTDRLESVEALQFADRTIYLDGRNNGPIARADVLATNEDGVIIIPASRLTGNDSDFDGDRIRITAVGGAVNASVALDAAGNIVITPATNFSGTATFTYTLTDARGGTDTGSVTVNVSAVADAPTLNAGNASGNEDSAVALNIGAALTDLDGSESLKVIVSGVPAGASLSAGVNNGDGSWTLGAADLAGLTITPSANSDADFTLSVKAIATESSNGSSAETVRSMTVTINAVADAPVVSAANVSGNEDGVIGLDLSAALSDTDGSEALATVTITGVPAGAALSAGTHNPDGSWSLAPAELATLQFIPAANFNGPVNLQVTVASAEASNGSTATASQSFIVTVIPVNDAPVIAEGPQSGATTEDNSITASGQFTATDVDDGATQSWSVSGGGVGSYGNLSVDSSGAWTYTLANGAANVQTLAAGESHVETFVVRVTDDAGATDERSVSITVAGTNDGPVITSSATDASGSATEETVLTASGQLSASDVDAGATQAWSIVGSAAGSYGSLSVNEQTGAWTYALANGAANVQRLAAGESHLETFTVRVTDDQGATAEQTVSITVSGTNDGPVITSSEADAGGSATEETVLTASGQLSASDVDAGATQAWSIVGPATGSYGSLSVNEQTGAWTYALANGAANVQALAAGESRVETFTVRVTDDQGATAEQIVSITVSGSNDGPVITNAVTDASGSATEETVLTASGQLTASDVDAGATQAWSIVGSATGSYGSLSVNDQTGAWTYALANGAANVQRLAAGESHLETFTVRVTDDQGATAEQAVSITVSGTNDGPVITSSEADAGGSATEETVLTASGQLTASDVDAGATQAWSIVGSAAGSYGSLSVNDQTGAWTYTLANGSVNVQRLAAGESHLETFTVRVTDDQGATAEQIVSITVSGSNDGPVITNAVTDASGSATEETVLTASGQLTASDVDAGATQAWSIVGPATGSYGSLSVDNQTGAWTYVLANGSDNVQALAAGESHVETFTVRVTDDQGATAEQTVNVIVRGTNDGPVAVADTGSQYNDMVQSFDVLSNDSDVDAGDTRRLVAASVAAGQGSVTIVNDEIVFDPGNDFRTLIRDEVAQVIVTYTIADAAGAQSTSTLTLDVIGTNAPPVAPDVSIAGNEDGVIIGVIPATDEDGDSLTFGLETETLHGRVTLNGDGSFLYVPDANFNGTDGFVYRVTDGAGGLSRATVTLTVNSVNDRPQAVADSFGTDEDAALVVSAAQLLANDTDIDAGDTKTLVSVQAAVHGTVNFDGVNVSFAPEADYFGVAGFTYTMRDAAGATSTATVQVVVQAVNDAPTANWDTFTGLEDSPTLIDGWLLLLNDLDIDQGDTLSLVSVQDALGGTVQLSGNLITFTTAANYAGGAAFDYTVRDQAGETSTATVVLNILSIMDAPVAVADSSSTDEDTALVISAATLAGNDFDPDGNQPITLRSVQDAVHGTVSFDGANVTFIPDANYFGPASFTYTVVDADYLASTTYGTNPAEDAFWISTATVQVDVRSVNDAPVITSNGGGSAATVSVAENTAAITTVAAVDPDSGSTRTYSIVGGADADRFTINAMTGVLAFVTAPNFEAPTDADINNVYDVTVQASDGQGGIDTQVLAVTVTNANEAPVITSNGGGASAGVSIAENTTAVTTVAAIDPDSGSTRTYSIAGGADAGRFTINAMTGVLAFVTAPNFEAPTDADINNVYDVTVQASDGQGGIDTQVLAVTVTNANDAPVITSNGGGTSAGVSIAENTTAVTTVAAIDPDSGSTRTYSIAGGADAGRFTINAMTGVLAFVTAPNFEVPTDANINNVYDVTVQASDGQGGVDTQTLAVTVTNVNESPVITSNGGGDSASISLTEGTTAVTTVTSTDPDAGATRTFSLTGADAAKFTINATTGALSFVAAPDFESPVDAGGDNAYDVNVVVSDGSLSDSQSLSITVVDGNDAPVIASNGGGHFGFIALPENTLAVTTVSAADPEGGTVTYAIAGGVDASKFSIDATSGALSFVAAPNFEAPADSGGNNIYDVVVSASDGVLFDIQALSVSVTNANEAPFITSNGGGSWGTANVGSGQTYVTQVRASDPDAGATLTYSLSGSDASQFTIDATGNLRFVSAQSARVTVSDMTTGQSTFGPSTRSVNVTVSDGTNTDVQTLFVEVGIAGDDFASVSAGGTLYALGTPFYDTMTRAQLGQGALANVLGGFRSTIYGSQSDAAGRFGGNVLPVSDDAFVGPVALNANGDEWQIKFFDETYNSFYVANNGVMSFNAGVWAYTPQPLPASTNPLIAPFWADVDTRGTSIDTQLFTNAVYQFFTGEGNSTGTNRVWYNMDARSGIITVTWDDVGYYASRTDMLNAFQLQLIPREDMTAIAGSYLNYDAVFRYEQIEWLDGDASRGMYPQAGFDAGDFTNYYSQPNSRTVFMRDVETASNINVPGVFVYNISGTSIGTSPATGATGVLANDTTQSSTFVPTASLPNVPNIALRVTEVNGVAASVGQRITLASGARLLMSLDGTFVYDVANTDAVAALRPGQSMTDSFTYTVKAFTQSGVALVNSFGQNLIDHGTQTITINGVNDAPVARADSATVTEDIALTASGNVLSNDSDPDAGSSLTVTAGTIAGTYGSMVLSSNGQYTYTLNNTNTAVHALNDGQTLTDTLAYSVVDDTGLASTGTLSVSILGHTEAHTAVTATNDSFSGAALATGNVLSNDVRYSGATLSVVDPGVRIGQYGVLQILANGTATYVLDSSKRATAGGETFSYKVTDGLYTSTGSVSVSITQAPVVTRTGDNDFVTLRENGVGYGFAGGVLAGFSSATASNKLVAFGTAEGRVDEGYQFVDLGGTTFDVKAAGQQFSGFYINANGSISFANGQSTWSPLASTMGPMVAPFWADVDMRNALSGTAYYHVDESGKIATVTWDRVGYNNQKGDKLNTFQVQLVDRGDGGFDTVFRYGDMTWNQADSMVAGGSFAVAGIQTSNPAESLTLASGATTLNLDVSKGNTGYVGQWVADVDGAPQAYGTNGVGATYRSSLLANDGVTGGVVVGVNGSAAAVGSTITLTSGALLTVYSDGSYIYRPNHAFDSLGEGQVASDSFTYTYTYTNAGVMAADSATVNLTILGNGANDVINGTSFNETLTGGAGHNVISGFAGDDVIAGGAGNDWISGGMGADRLTGNAGRDTFVFRSGEAGVDTIADFTAGSGGDSLDIRDLLTGYTPSSSISSFVRLDAAGANTNVMVDADGAGTGFFVQVATLQGVTGLLLNDLLVNQNLIAA